MAKTYGDIKSKVWTLLGQKSTSITFSSSIIGDAINNRILDFLRGKITSLIDHNRVYSSGKIWIREGSTYLRTVLSSSLSADMNAGAVVIYCDTTNLASSGWVEIGDEQLSYTSKTSTTLTGVSASTVKHLSGANVRQLYSMPTNFEKPIAVYLIDEPSGTISGEIPLNSQDHTIYYEIVKKTSANLIRITGLDSNSLVEIRYSSVYTPMSLDSDICVIPDHYGDTVISYIVAGELGLDKGIPNAQNLLVRGYANLQNCYQYFNTESNTPKQRIKPRSYQFNSLRKGKTTQ